MPDYLATITLKTLLCVVLSALSQVHHLSAQEPAEPGASEEPQTFEILVDLPDSTSEPGDTVQSTESSKPPYVQDLVGILNPDDQDVLEQRLRSGAEAGDPQLYVRTVPLKDMREKEKWLTNFLNFAEHPVLVLIFTEQSGTTLLGLNTAVEELYGRENLQQWNREAREESRQVLGNSTRVMTHAQGLLTRLTEEPAGERVPSAPPAVEPAAEIPAPAAQAAPAQAAAPAREESPTPSTEPSAASSPPEQPAARLPLGDVVEAQVREIIEQQQVSDPDDNREPAAEPAQAAVAGQGGAPAQNPSSLSFISGAALGLLMAGLGFAVMLLLRRRRKSSAKEKLEKPLAPDGKQDPPTSSPVPQFPTKPREPKVASSKQESNLQPKTSTAPDTPATAAQKPASPAPVLPGKNVRQSGKRKFDTTDTEKGVTNPRDREKDVGVMQSSSQSDRRPLKPRRIVASPPVKPAESGAPSPGSTGDKTDAKAPQPEPFKPAKPQAASSSRVGLRPRQVRQEKTGAPDPAAPSPGTSAVELPQHLQDEYEELQALAAAEAPAGSKPDAAMLEEIYERYSRLLEIAPAGMRADILKSLEALVREMEADNRQKRLNTASREPVALKEERDRQHTPKNRKDGPGDSGKSRRKESVY